MVLRPSLKAPLAPRGLKTRALNSAGIRARCGRRRAAPVRGERPDVGHSSPFPKTKHAKVTPGVAWSVSWVLARGCKTAQTSAHASTEPPSSFEVSDQSSYPENSVHPGHARTCWLETWHPGWLGPLSTVDLLMARKLKIRTVGHVLEFPENLRTPFQALEKSDLTWPPRKPYLPSRSRT